MHISRCPQLRSFVLSFSPMLAVPVPPSNPTVACGVVISRPEVLRLRRQAPAVFVAVAAGAHHAVNRLGRKAGKQGQERSVTEVLLELPRMRGFGDMPAASLQRFQASIAASCDSMEAQEVVEALGKWRSALLKGCLPNEASWPPEPLVSEVQKTMQDLDMLSLISERPELVDSVLLNMLDATRKFESQSASIAAQGDGGEDEDSMLDIQLPNLSLNFPNGDASTSAGQLEGEVKAEKMEQMEDDPKAAATVDPSTTSLEVAMEGTEMTKKDMEEATLKELVREFLQEAAAAAQVLPPEGLEGQGLRSWRDLEGFQANMLESEESQGTGATASTVDTSYFALYRQLLGRLPELHELIRRLGRKAGLRATKKALAQREDSRAGAGVVRSAMMQAETSGITRSDGRLLLLPSELSLLAYANAQPPRSNAAGAKALHRLRRAEASLLSYERSAWTEEKARNLSWREFRPAFERGPLICCVDTSRSMAGKEEAVAKAAVLEILRLAENERRRCHLFFFSGPNQLEELEIPAPPIPSAAWQGVLDFLGRSFQGTTDLDAPLAASLQCLEGYESIWQTADLLFVTDSKVEEPSIKLLEKLKAFRKEGLRVFALIVLQDVEAHGMKVLTDICDEVGGCKAFAVVFWMFFRCRNKTCHFFLKKISE